MPFALVIIGLLAIVTSARDTQDAFAAELRTDFTGPPKDNFIWWLAALGSVGALGYVKPLAPFSKAFLVLIFVVMILAQSKDGRGGFFAQLNAAIAAGPEKQAPQSAAPGSGASIPISVGNTSSTNPVANKAAADGNVSVQFSNMVQNAITSLFSQ